MFYNLKKNTKKGFTLIEALLVLTISVIATVSAMQYLAAKNKDLAVSNLSNNISKTMFGVMKRLQHDGADYDFWEATYASATVKPSQYRLNTYMQWDTNDQVVNGFLSEFLVGYQHVTCPGAWNPENDSAGNETETAKTAYVPCTLWKAGIPFDLNMQVLANNGTGGFFRDLSIYIDFSNSEIFKDSTTNSPNGKNFSAVSKFAKSIESHLKNELIGGQFVEFANKGVDLYDPLDDKTFSTMECLKEIQNGRTCLLRFRLDITDSSNDRYLRVNGTNSMIDNISFSIDGGITKQKCAHWVQNGGVWDSSMTECGIHGGRTSSDLSALGDVEFVGNDAYVKNLFISYDDAGSPEVAIDRMCKQYTFAADGSYQYLTNVSGTTEDTPCGLFVDDSGATHYIQLVTNDAYVGRVFAENIVSQKIAANSLRLKFDPNNAGVNIFELVDKNNVTAFTITNDGAFLIGELGSNVPSVDIYSNNTNVHGEMLVKGNFTTNSNSYFQLDDNGELVQIQMGARGNIDISNNYINDSRGASDINDGSVNTTGATSVRQYLGINATGINNGFIVKSDKDIAIQAADDVSVFAGDSLSLGANKNILLESNTIVTGNGRIFSNRSTFRNEKVEQIDSTTNIKNEVLNNTAGAKSFELATVDHVQHAINMASKIVTQGTKIVDSGNYTIPKPECLSFVNDGGANISNPYYKNGTTDVYTRNNAKAWGENGDSLARIILVPLWFKTYNAGFENNQMYAQHALDDAGNHQWVVYQYLQGEGASGVGGREDGAGSSIAILYCDYTGIF